MNDFRRCGQSTERRRRMMQDEGLGNEPGSSDAPAGDGPSPRARKRRSRYSQADCMAAQPRVTDLIPRKPLTLVLLFLAGLLLIAGLEALYYWMPRLAASASDGRIAAFDLDSEGSLGAFASSMLLLSASLVCLQIWSLRRHRLDDYHGRYRIWFWAAVVWFVMSIDEACSLHEGFKELMSHTTGRRLFGDGSLWWVIAYGLVLGVVAIRLLMDMRSCRTSTTLFVLTGISWTAAVAWQLQLVMPASGARGVMIEESCELLGNLLLLLALAVHARYVLMDVEGAIPTEEKRKKPKRAKAESSSETSAAESNAVKESAKPAGGGEKRPAATFGSGSVSKPASTAPTDPPKSSAATAARVDPPQDPLEARRLSKQERRAQRRAARDREE